MKRWYCAPLIITLALAAVAAPLLLSGCTRNYYYLSDSTDPLSVCISNQKQIVTAARMYSDDWDSTFPIVGRYSNGFYGTWDPVSPQAWTTAILPYLRVTSFQCPLVGHQPSPSYGWNRHLTRYPEALVHYPATTPLCWDWVPGVYTAPGIPLDPGWAGLAEWGYYPTNTGASNMDMARACSRHSEGSSTSLLGGLILGFVDGHAAFERPTRWTPQNTAGRFMPCDDGALPWPPAAQQGVVISMYPRDPMAP